MTGPIHFFTRNDPYFELSNFAPFGFEVDGEYWPTVEHYFQAQKFVLPTGLEHRQKTRAARSPKEAKTLGQSRSVVNRTDWEAVKEDVMRDALHRKFKRPELRKLLVATRGRKLIENSPFDRYWGIGPDGSGLNRLGELLMELRVELLEQDV